MSELEVRYGLGGVRVVERCRHKTRYASKKDALTMFNHRTKGRHHRRHGRAEFLRVYHCRFCNGWHLTHRGDDP